MRVFGHESTIPIVTLSRRRLPHISETTRAVFLTWRLSDSLPANRAFPPGSLTSGQAFAAMDRLLDNLRSGPTYLRQPALANMLVEAIQYNAETLRHYVLHAFVVMPNHVHLLITPAVPLPMLTKSLKGITAKRANAVLGLTGIPFWQDETYDHVVRNEREFERIRNYIEGNPVRAGLVKDTSAYRWSSAGWATGGSPADQGVCPTAPSMTQRHETPHNRPTGTGFAGARINSRTADPRCRSQSRRPAPCPAPASIRVVPGAP